MEGAQVSKMFPLAPDEHVNKLSSIVFVGVHFLPLLAIFTGANTIDWVMCAAFFVLRMFFITAGYHRYFAHRSYRTSRALQFVLAFGGGMAAQKGALWWAANHRLHHRYSDTPSDFHTPRKGFWFAHVGWVLADHADPTREDVIPDLMRFPELRFLNRHDWIPPWTLGVVTFLIGGWSGLLIGFFLSTVLLWHGTFLVNSVAHLQGRRRFETADTSRNNWWIAIITLGEGWHNNHHHYPPSARQGFYWWEYDVSFYVIWLLERVRLVWDVKRPDPKVLAHRRIGSTPLEEREPALVGGE